MARQVALMDTDYDTASLEALHGKLPELKFLIHQFLVSEDIVFRVNADAYVLILKFVCLPFEILEASCLHHPPQVFLQL